MGIGDKLIKIVFVEKKIFCTGPTGAPKAEPKKNLLYRQYKPNESTKEGPLSFVLFESPFTSVSTVSRGQPHPSLDSLFRHVVLTASVSLNFRCEIVFYTGNRSFFFNMYGRYRIFSEPKFLFILIFIFSITDVQSFPQSVTSSTRSLYSRYSKSNTEVCTVLPRVADPHLAFSRYLDPRAAFLKKCRNPLFYPTRILDPGIKKAPDPGSGSATVSSLLVFLI
jgi:hypothetical protein